VARSCRRISTPCSSRSGSSKRTTPRWSSRWGAPERRPQHPTRRWPRCGSGWRGWNGTSRCCGPARTRRSSVSRRCRPSSRRRVRRWTRRRARRPPSSAASTPPVAGPGAVPGTAIGVDLYRLGYSDYAKGNYELALAELQDFVRLNPADDLADDAQYLIGEIYFSQQKYPEAVAAFDRLLAEHAGGDKAAAAYLKKGLALLEMNRTADAVIQLQHIVSAYPKSEEARLARERLRALGLRER